MYPTIVVGLLGICGLQAIHRRISGTPWEDPVDEELRNHMVDMDSNFTWVDHFTWVCFAGGRRRGDRCVDTLGSIKSEI